MDPSYAAWANRAVVWMEPWLAELREQSLGQLTVSGLGGVIAFCLLWWAVRRFAALQWVDEARRTFRGHWGELKVRWALRLWFKDSHQWHNVFVACPNGLTQVDHVLVTGRGVFVLETKNFRDAEQREESKGGRTVC